MAAAGDEDVEEDADGLMDVDDDGCDFLLKDNGDDLDLRLERLEVSGANGSM